MSIENMFGDLDKIDILAETKTGWPVILRVTLGREPDEHILALLSKCPAWAADYGVKLEIEIGYAL